VGGLAPGGDIQLPADTADPAQQQQIGGLNSLSTPAN
jgi:hypothetical protein